MFELVAGIETMAYRYAIESRYTDADIERALLDFILRGLMKV